MVSNVEEVSNVEVVSNVEEVFQSHDIQAVSN